MVLVVVLGVQRLVVQAGEHGRVVLGRRGLVGQQRYDGGHAAGHAS
ncbi:MAG TPA: hypothetical protein PLQ29_05380 [Spirochaetales bacterium]|nr:hypothetical protein [Spirochaetales bacterium]